MVSFIVSALENEGLLQIGRWLDLEQASRRTGMSHATQSQRTSLRDWSIGIEPPVEG